MELLQPFLWEDKVTLFYHEGTVGYLLSLDVNSKGHFGMLYIFVLRVKSLPYFLTLIPSQPLEHEMGWNE